MMTRRGTRNKRTRSKRNKGGSSGAPRKNRNQSTSEVTARQLSQAAKVHGKRSPQAQRTDESMKAPIASSIEEWLQNPNRRDLPGVDYPGKSLQEAIEQLETPKKVRKDNPFKDSRTAKKHIQPIFKKYRDKLGIKREVKISAVNKGYPAKVVQRKQDAPVIRFNYTHFRKLNELLDQKTFDRYVEYAVSHELAHVKQREELGWKGLKDAKRRNPEAFELDADERACKAMGCTVESIVEMIDEGERQLLKKSDSPVKDLPSESKRILTRVSSPPYPTLTSEKIPGPQREYP